MAFAFNFDGDDIEDDASGTQGVSTTSPARLLDAPAAHAVPVQEHSVSEWFSSLPSRLFYTVQTLRSPTGKTATLPRRELFDVRAQLMAEDDASTLKALSESDISRNVYEGGFKTWECSLDLASFLLERGPHKDIGELARVAAVVELGAGSAMPTLVLFQHALRNSFPTHFILADYNAEVLRLVTIPNLLLAWALTKEPNAIAAGGAGDFDVTEDIIAEFKKDLQCKGISLHCFSGPWSEELLRMMPRSVHDMTTLVLAAETIYSPAALGSFVDLVHGILREGGRNEALVAAKKFYFGVGGSTDALKSACRDRGMVAEEVENAGVLGMDEGVGRAILEIQMS